MRLALVCSALITLLLVPASPAPTRGHLDPAFGDGGVVELNPLVDARNGAGAARAAPDGGAFFTEQAWRCGERRPCTYDVFLKRFRPDGSVDAGFAAGGAVVATRAWGAWSLAVDTAGRPLLAWEPQARTISIRRFRRDGSRDRSFGRGGTVSLRCACELGSLALAPGGRVILSGGDERVRGREYVGMAWAFMRLLPDGSLDSGFGGDGRVRLPVRRRYDDLGYDAAAAGALALAGDLRLGGEWSPPFVSRLSPAGRLDGSYAARATRSLRGMYETGRDGLGWDQTSVVARPGGAVEVYAGTYNYGGVAIRLRRDGARDRTFGAGGVKQIPLHQLTAVADGAGTFLTGWSPRRRGYVVIRLRADGRPDRAFGEVALPGAGNEFGLAISVAKPGAAIVLDHDEVTCRSSCPPSPKLFRVVR